MGRIFSDSFGWFVEADGSCAPNHPLIEIDLQLHLVIFRDGWKMNCCYHRFLEKS